MSVVGTDTERVSAEKAIADEEEKKVQKINEEVTKKQQDCQRDLSKAEPALQAAEAALNTLNKVNWICRLNFYVIRSVLSFDKK